MFEKRRRGMQIMRNALSLLLPLGALFVSGCASFGGDMIVRISGSIPARTVGDASGKFCQLEIISAETGKRGVAKNINAEFSVAMMVVAGPKPKPYYFEAECRGEKKFRSDNVFISSKSSYSRNFDLGVFVEEIP